MDGTISEEIMTIKGYESPLANISSSTTVTDSATYGWKQYEVKRARYSLSDLSNRNVILFFEVHHNNVRLLIMVSLKLFQVTVHAGMNFYVGFVVTLGHAFESDFAIDDITTNEGKCSSYDGCNQTLRNG